MTKRHHHRLKRHHKWAIAAAAVATAISAPVATKIANNPTPPVVSNTTSSCHIKGNLPDPVCTPGVTDPQVTQANLQDTICKPGYTKTVRPPVSYTSQLKATQIAQYGYSDTNLRDYEEDHLISLELGGSPADPKNLWPEPGASPNAKDKVENQLHTKICNGQLTLQEAQSRISTDWETALN